MVALAVSVACAIPAAPASSALDSTVVSASGSAVTITGSPSGDAFGIYTDCTTTECTFQVGRTLRGTGVPVVAGAGCEDRAGMVRCLLPGAPTVAASLGDGGDVMEIVYPYNTSTTLTVVADGGPGDDLLVGGGEHETWLGGEGNDIIEPDSQAGRLDPPGPDIVSGGPGVDTIETYAGSTSQGANVSLDGVANDGSGQNGDVDDIKSDIETLRGTGSDDVLVGTAGPQTIVGEGGNDRIDGGPGYDTINADSTDLLVSGNDIVSSRDGEADYVACGPGADTLTADDVDQIAQQAQDACENVTLSPVRSGDKGLGVKGKRLDANRTRTRASIRLVCGAASRCAGKAVVRTARKGPVLATARYRIKAGRTAEVTFRLTDRARAVLRRQSATRAVLTIRSAGVSKRIRLVR